MNIFFRERKNGSIFVVGIGLYLLALIFLIVSLASYNPTDSSWVYISSDVPHTTNFCGSIGAHLAALLIYLFGGAAFLLLIPLLLGLYIYAQRQRFGQEWERLGASIYIVFVSAALCTVNGGDGGVIGLLFAQKLAYYFDMIGRAVFLSMSMSVCVVLLLRWSFMFVVQWVIAAVVYCHDVIQRYHIVSKIAHIGAVCAYTIFVRPTVVFVKFIQSLLDGDAFNDTGLVVPDDVDDEYIYVPQEKVNFAIASLQWRKEGARLKEDIECAFFNKFRTSAQSIIKKQKPYTGSVRAPEREQEELSPGITKEVVKTFVKKASHYALPQRDIFIAEKNAYQDCDLEKELHERANVLHDKLKRFGVTGEVVAIKRGPVVTLFEYQPDIDTKLSKIIVLEDDLAMALQAMSIRILAPIPGRSVVGFEVANNKRNDVLFSQIVTSPAYTNFSGALPLVLGKGTIGEVVVVDLARMPHLLIAGSTGSGKSVALNAILISLLCKLSPDELKLILIDPKRLEFASFTDIAHLLFPIVTSPAHAAPVLRWVVQEMEDRYEKMAQRGARNIADYNARLLQQVQDERGEDNEQPLPFIVVMIDELADLMITAGRDIEDLITRITQMARAAGIHMIVATQRPSVDVITGLIKANFPSRISFRVASRIDSRTILDTMGADRLLGRGDMLFLDAATSQLRRVHGAYVSDEEIERVADHIRLQRKVEYLDHYQAITTQGNDLHSTDDVLYHDVRQFLDEIDEISISLLQRKFRIGYNRSARSIDMLESQGLIMPQDGGKTRKVIR